MHADIAIDNVTLDVNEGDYMVHGYYFVNLIIIFYFRKDREF